MLDTYDHAREGHLMQRLDTVNTMLHILHNTIRTRASDKAVSIQILSTIDRLAAMTPGLDPGIENAVTEIRGVVARTLLRHSH